MEHISLNDGDILKIGDEYSTEGLWRTIPDFMIGNLIPISNIKWRRYKNSTIAKQKKQKRWFQK